MIKFSIEHMNSYPIAEACTKLLNTPGFDAKLSYNAQKICSQILKEYERAKITFLGIADKYCERDEKGQFKSSPMGDLVPKAGMESEFLKEKGAFLTTEITINRLKLGLPHIERAGFTPNELAALAPAIEGLEET